MKKNRLFITLTLITALMAVLMCGCGSSNVAEEAKMVRTESAAGAAYDTIYDAAPMAEAAAEEAVEEEGAIDTEVSEEAAQEKTDRKLIKNVEVVDIYTDDKGKSITVRLYFSHAERTLTMEEVMEVVNGIIKELEQQGIKLKVVPTV